MSSRGSTPTKHGRSSKSPSKTRTKTSTVESNISRAKTPESAGRKRKSDKDASDKTLVDHVNNAEKVLYDLRYVVKFMRSAAEAKRIQQEKQMAKDFEKQEEQRRIEFLKNQELAGELHDASTLISLLYRTKKARRIVQEKKVQVSMEAVIKHNRELDSQWIPVQKAFRQYSTRKWFSDRGVKYKINRKKKKKRPKAGEVVIAPISKEEMQQRIAFEVNQRRAVARDGTIQHMFHMYVQALQVRRSLLWCIAVWW